MVIQDLNITKIPDIAKYISLEGMRFNIPVLYVSYSLYQMQSYTSQMYHRETVNFQHQPVPIGMLKIIQKIKIMPLQDQKYQHRQCIDNKRMII